MEKERNNAIEKVENLSARNGAAKKQRPQKTAQKPSGARASATSDLAQTKAALDNKERKTAQAKKDLDKKEELIKKAISRREEKARKQEEKKKPLRLKSRLSKSGAKNIVPKS